MRASDLKIGEWYNHKTAPTYYYAKVVKVLKPKEDENTNNYIVVKCIYCTRKDDSFGLIKYFRPRDLVRIADM